MRGAVITDHEAIETITLCRCSGTLGLYTKLTDDRAKVELLDTKGDVRDCFIVRHTAHGWRVSWCHYTFEASELIDAARNAMQFRDERRGRNIVTVNYAL